MNDRLKKSEITPQDAQQLLSAMEMASERFVGCLKSDRREKMPDIERITLQELRSKKRIMEYIYSRMIFAHHFSQTHTLMAIARFLGIKAHATISNYLKNYESDFMYVRGFRRYSWEVTRLMRTNKEPSGEE